MGKRGPAPKPQALKDIEGNPGKRALNKNQVEPKGSPSLPAHLDEYAKGVWKRIAEAMPSRLYTQADRELLAGYCTAAAMHRKAILKLRTEGEVAYGESGAPYQNPWISILNKQAQLMATLGGRLGLDPAARNSLSLPRDDDQPKSKFHGLTAIEGGRNAS